MALGIFGWMSTFFMSDLIQYLACMGRRGERDGGVEVAALLLPESVTSLTLIQHTLACVHDSYHALTIIHLISFSFDVARNGN